MQRAAYDDYGPDGTHRGFDGGVDMDDLFAEMFGGASFGFGGGFSFDTAGKSLRPIHITSLPAGYSRHGLQLNDVRRWT